VFVLGSEDKLAGVEIDLRAVQQGAQITQIKTFDITIDNVVQTALLSMCLLIGIL
jgi:hypothetical protein